LQVEIITKTPLNGNSL